MTSGGEWDLTVPDDDDGLLAELHRHGVHPGQRLHIVVRDDAATEAEPATTLPAFIASFAGAPDLAERSEEILAAEFPGTR